jgi:hypothetical protein
MSSSQFVLAYACERPDAMSPEELRLRRDAATAHMEDVAATPLDRVDVGDGRTGLIVWQHPKQAISWPMVSTRGDEAAAWLHVPAAAGSREDAGDPMMLARGVTEGTIDPVELGAPCAALHWSPDGLRIVNDRLGMVRLYVFEVPGFGYVWSSRPGLAHIFAGLVPELQQSVWNDMATLGWAGDGSAHLGNGRQMPASTRVHVSPQGATSVDSDRDQWILATADGDVPSMAEGARGMVRSLGIASWWPGKPVADLSGGKDSRVTAAAAIRAEIVDTVRTVNTDTGEVDTARELLRLADDPVEHRIDPVVQPKKPEGSVLDRYLSTQRAWEGAYNARSAYRTNPFKGFRPAATPRINGLGGEAVQGRTLLSPAWEAKMEGQGPELGRQRLSAMIRSGAVGVTEENIEDSVRSAMLFGDDAERLGMTSSFMVVDHFFNFSKMPYWSMPQAAMNTLLPFYAPQMLPRAIWATFRPNVEYGRLHRDLLREILPAWAGEPFYKGSAKTRATPWMWENEDWKDLSETILDGVSTLETFNRPRVEQYVADANDGKGSVKFELVLSRVMWELSFREFALEIARLAEDTARRATEIRSRAVEDHER